MSTSHLKSARLVAGALLLTTVVVGGLWAWRGSPKEDPFNACVAKAVMDTHDATRKLNVKIPGALVRLFSGSGKSEPLDLSVEGMDKEVYRKLTEVESSQLIAACARQYGKERAALDVTVQVWAEVDGQQVNDVKVMRERNSGDDCVTHDGRGCTLALHGFDPSTKEAFRASYPGYEGRAEYDAMALGKGAATLALTEHGETRAVRVLVGVTPVNAKVTVALPAGEKPFTLRSLACVAENSFRPDCNTAWTQGTLGQDGAFFLLPPGLGKLYVTVVYQGSRNCTVEAQTGSFNVDWNTCGVCPSCGKVPACPKSVGNAVSRLLDQVQVPSTIDLHATVVSFAIADNQLKVVKANDKLQQLAAKALQESAMTAAPCSGHVTWRVR